MEAEVFYNSTEARRAMVVKMFRYEQWCTQMGKSPDLDENWNSYCEMMNNR